jgi:hypothetical protein
MVQALIEGGQPQLAATSRFCIAAFTDQTTNTF